MASIKVPVNFKTIYPTIMKTEQSKNPSYGALTTRYKKGSDVGEIIEWFKENEDNNSDIIRNFIFYCFGYKALEQGGDQQKIREQKVKALSYLASMTAEIEANLKYSHLSGAEFSTEKRFLVHSAREKQSSSIIKENPLSKSFKL